MTLPIAAPSPSPHRTRIRERHTAAATRRVRLDGAPLARIGGAAGVAAGSGGSASATWVWRFAGGAPDGVPLRRRSQPVEHVEVGGVVWG
jgi:hypothetical protein